jgi:hypothetical protein
VRLPLPFLRATEFSAESLLSWNRLVCFALFCLLDVLPFLGKYTNLDIRCPLIRRLLQMYEMAMASVGAISNVHVGIGHVNELHPNVRPNTIDSIPIGITTHTHTQRFINARARTKIAVCLLFSFNQQHPEQTFPGDFVEVKIRFDGAVVSHTRTPVNTIDRRDGELWFDTFMDLSTNGSTKRAEFRNIGKGMTEINYVHLLCQA